LQLICIFYNHENFPYYGQIKKKAIKTDSTCTHLLIIIEAYGKAEWKIFAFPENRITVCMVTPCLRDLLITFLADVVSGLKK
jgi:hypothetical protein